MPEIPSFTKSEWLIMARLWEKYPMTAAEIVQKELDGKRLSDATVRTLLRRLVAKKAVGYSVDESNANLYYYHPMVCEKDCMLKERKNFLELYYRNNIGELIAGFVSDAELSQTDAEKMRKILDQLP